MQINNCRSFGAFWCAQFSYADYGLWYNYVCSERVNVNFSGIIMYAYMACVTWLFMQIGAACYKLHQSVFTWGGFCIPSTA